MEIFPFVSRKQLETNVIPESTLTSKYHSVIVKGFRADTSWDSISEILSQQGLPREFNEENVIQNEKTGNITLENLSPVDCLSLISNMNRKRFLNRQVYVTSVVSASPVKPKVQVTRSGSSSSSVEDNLPPNLGTALAMIPPPPSPKNLVPDPLIVESPTSPSVQEKISQIEKQTSSSSAADLASISRVDKRKPEDSPETAELSRKEKKMLKGEERKQDKLKKKLEYKQKNSVNVQINHSY